MLYEVITVCEIGAIAQRRIATLVDPALNCGLPAFLAKRPGINSGLMIAEVTSAALMSENKQMSHPASVDSTPTSANQEDHVSMACHGARRLLRMTRNLFVILGRITSYNVCYTKLLRVVLGKILHVDFPQGIIPF